VNVRASTAEPPFPAQVIEPATQIRERTTVSEAEGDWLCAFCLTRVANERDRFAYDGRDEFSFVNPEGIHFEILTFSRTHDCRQAGIPTLDHTWFAGHAWSYCHCGGCGQHLGWFYIGQHEFAGLIKTRIVRALCLRN
jgi:hypothetical protein